MHLVASHCGESRTNGLRRRTASATRGSLNTCPGQGCTAHY